MGNRTVGWGGRKFCFLNITSMGKTALQLAVNAKQWESVKYLLSVGADPERKNRNNRMAMDITRDGGSIEFFVELVKTHQ